MSELCTDCGRLLLERDDARAEAAKLRGELATSKRAVEALAETLSETSDRLDAERAAHAKTQAELLETQQTMAATANDLGREVEAHAKTSFDLDVTKGELEHERADIDKALALLDPWNSGDGENRNVVTVSEAVALLIAAHAKTTRERDYWKALAEWWRARKAADDEGSWEEFQDWLRANPEPVQPPADDAGQEGET